jgi:hypothetical protein
MALSSVYGGGVSHSWVRILSNGQRPRALTTVDSLSPLSYVERANPSLEQRETLYVERTSVFISLRGDARYHH